MPAPTTSLATLRPDLAASLEEYDLEADRMGFIAHRLLPVINVASQAGAFGRIKLEQLLQNRETTRAPGGGYSRATWQFDDDSYATVEHGAEEPIDDNQKAMYREYIDAELVCTRRARDAVLRKAEQRVQALLQNTTTWTGSAKTTAITNEWDDFTNATPITDVMAAVQKVWDGCGLWPNALQINRKQFNNLRQCAQVIDRIASSGAGAATKARDITVAQLAACFDLDYILVAGSAQNSANPGQTRSLSMIWSDEYAIVCRVANSNDFQEPCLGRTFHWTGDGSMEDGLIETYRDETIRGDVVRCRRQTQEKVLYTEAAHLLSNVTT